MIEIQEDTKLIQNILNGDPKAQKILYENYSESVKNFLKNKYSSYHDLDDDVAEIMIKVFMKLETYDNKKSKFRSWVFTIAKNHVIDKWRCSSCIKTTDIDNIILTATTNSGFVTTNSVEIQVNPTYTTCTDFENCSSINYISTQLSATDFTLLDMKYVQGYNYVEIGKEFNLTSSTISNRVNYIKTKLKNNKNEIVYE